MIRDLVYAWRLLLKNKAFSCIAVASLAVAMGANTAVFGVATALLLSRLPVRDASSVFMIYETNRRQGVERGLVSYLNFKDWQQQSLVFDRMAAVNFRTFNFVGKDETYRIDGEIVSSHYFELLGIKATRGRTFLEEDDDPAGTAVAVVSHGFWKQRFAGDSNIVGRSIKLGEANFTVVGIAPEGFQGLHGTSELWVPIGKQVLVMPFELLKFRGVHWLQVVGRLRTGLSGEQAQAAMETLARQLEHAYPKEQAGRGVIVRPLQEELVDPLVRQSMMVLVGAVGLVLLIACLNLANLLLARAVGRQKEIAIRLAMGASRIRLVRQLLAESVLLSGVGGSLGFLLASWGVHFLDAVRPATGPRIAMRMDLSVALFSLGLSLVTGVLFGLIPALQASRTDVNQELRGYDALGMAPRQGPGGFRRLKLRNLLVTFEIAMALVLLIGASLMTKSFQRLQLSDLGFRPDHLLMMRVDLPSRRYPAFQAASFCEQLDQRFQALPGVESVSVASDSPFSGNRSSTNFTIEGRDSVEPGSEPVADYSIVSPRHFETLGTALLRGRDFTVEDRDGTPRVIIINQTMARRFWPGLDPIGKRIHISSPQGFMSAEIVGLVANMKHRLPEGERPVFYRPLLQSPIHNLTLLLRTTTEPKGLIESARREVLSLDRELPAYEIKTMEERVKDWLSGSRFSALMLSIFAGIALMLAVLGVYGLVAYSASQRTREIGIRMALGAQPVDVFKLVLSEGLVLSLTGVGLGLAGAFALTRLLRGLLYGVGTMDLSTFAGASLVLCCVALVASYVPARAAAKVHPTAALQC